MDSIVPEIEQAEGATYSDKVEINYNSEELIQNENGLKQVLNSIPLFRQGN
ncbi:hypothetical protein [Chryseobacterium sp.]|uniref:hypothetical protein n=1 Tax=Chryseobacterium sp. TaxID=1871047 RepID=UPI00321B8F26